MPGGYSDGSGSSLPAKCLPHALAEEGGREEGREGGRGRFQPRSLNMECLMRGSALN
jgi:hypothetical protein